MKGAGRDAEGNAVRQRGIQSFWGKHLTTALDGTDDPHKWRNEFTIYDCRRSLLDMDLDLDLDFGSGWALKFGILELGPEI